eukprot:gene7912-16197_t
MSFLLDQEKPWFQRDFGLDLRLIKALSKLGFTYPTIVQAKSIPIALQGKDILVRARTGSGKTAAFLLPTLHKILTSKESEKNSIARIRAIILAPTKELCKQIEKHANDLIYYCKESISVCSFSDDNHAIQQYRLNSKPDIIISTPARLVHHLKSSNGIDFSHVATLVIDEADLILSFGYSEDVHSITSKMPKIFQGLLMSATLSPELEKFKRVVLHNPAVIKLEETKSTGHLLQFYLESTEHDKYLILYVFIKLGLLQGKGIIFINDINKCYRLKLFLQQFFVPAAVLNAELPINSRLHILEEFNRGVFDYLIATDSSIDHGAEDEEEEDSDDGDEIKIKKIKRDNHENTEREIIADIKKTSNNNNEEDDDNEEKDDDDDDDKGVPVSKKNNKMSDKPTATSTASTKTSKTTSNKGAKSRADPGYGVSRGIDFQNVSFVVNFDFPKTVAAYTHRIGRTARAGATGTSLSFVQTESSKDEVTTGTGTTCNELELLHTIQQQQAPLDDAAVENDNVLAALTPIDQTGVQSSNNVILQPALLQFNMKELDNFRYRVEDTLRSVTNAAVKECRTAELKQEILNSQKLKTYFAENPNDLKILRHDKAVLHPIRQKEHLRHVPDYLIPASMRSIANTNNIKKRKRKRAPGQTQENRKNSSKAKDPLQSFESNIADNEQNDNGNDNNTSSSSTYRAKSVAEDSSHMKEMGEDRVYSNNESIGYSTSGRQKWKIRHQKGKFSKKSTNPNPLRTKGSFSTLRNKKFA